jgi:hypothetical protein
MLHKKIRSQKQPQRNNMTSISFVGGDADKELEQYTRRAKWLLDHNVTDGDVMMDDDGREYIADEIEDGTPGEEGYGIRPFKNYLPDDCQSTS